MNFLSQQEKEGHIFQINLQEASTRLLILNKNEENCDIKHM